MSQMLPKHPNFFTITWSKGSNLVTNTETIPPVLFNPATHFPSILNDVPSFVCHHSLISINKCNKNFTNLYDMSVSMSIYTSQN